MKRILGILFSTMLMCGCLTACGQDTAGDATFKIGNSTFGESSETSAAKAEANADSSSVPAVTEKDKGISVMEGDILDLRDLSPTVVYSEVFAMMNEPADYEGKTIIAKGPFAHYDDERTNKQYYAVIVKDATACCAQGIEFVLAGDKKYPDDYPKDGDEVTVTGKFNSYEDVTGKYVQLSDAEILN